MILHKAHRDPIGARKSRTGYSGGYIGGSALVRKLHERGVKPGRHEARVEGTALVVDIGRSG